MKSSINSRQGKVSVLFQYWKAHGQGMDACVYDEFFFLGGLKKSYKKVWEVFTITDSLELSRKGGVSLPLLHDIFMSQTAKVVLYVYVS